MNNKLKKQKKAVIRLDTESKSTESFESISQASRKTGHTRKAISNSIKHDQPINKESKYKFI